MDVENLHAVANCQHRFGLCKGVLQQGEIGTLEIRVVVG